MGGIDPAALLHPLSELRQLLNNPGPFRSLRRIAVLRRSRYRVAARQRYVTGFSLWCSRTASTRYVEQIGGRRHRARAVAQLFRKAGSISLFAPPNMASSRSRMWLSGTPCSTLARVAGGRRDGAPRRPAAVIAINDPGLWCETGAADWGFRPALFLDRDGVIMADTGYPQRPEDVHLLRGAACAVARCNAIGIPVVVVTNQSGIARGYYDWAGFHAVQTTLCAALGTAGARLDAVLACAYHADGKEPLRRAAHPWRKPNSGMILTAAERMNLDLSRSWIIGDKPEDLASGAAAGLAGGTLVGPDDEPRQTALRLETRRFVVTTAASLADAVNALLEGARLAVRP